MPLHAINEFWCKKSSHSVYRLEETASFRNEDNALLPNQSVNTKVLVDTKHDVVLIAALAVHRNAQGTFVYVVKPDRTVVIRSIAVGASQGDTSEISRGLKAGELVVVDGTDNLHRGSRVSVQLAANPVAP